MIDTTIDKLNIAQYGLIGMPMKLYQWIPAVIIARKIKQKCPNTNIVIGGISTKNVAKTFLDNFKFFDFAIWGEGEQSLLLLTEYVEKHTTIDCIPHLTYRSGKEIKTNKCKLTYTNLNEICNPNYDDFVNYLDLYGKERNKVQIMIEGGRGCHWHRCKFCFLNEGYLFRTKAPENIVTEILYLIKTYGFRIFNFTDNDIVGNDMLRFNRLLDHLIKIKEAYPEFEIQMAEIITKDITENEIRKMSIAGFTNIQIGYESPSDSLLNKINKMNTFASNLLAMKWCKIYGIAISGLNITRGLLEETGNDINEAMQKLPFERFIINKSNIKHQYTSLAVSENSRYYTQIGTNGINKNYIQQEYGYIPSNIIKDEDRIKIFTHVKKQVNNNWKYYYEMEQNILDNPHSYALINDNENIYFKEYCNGKVIKILTFQKNSIHWKILCATNCQVASLDMMLKFGTHEIVKKCIDELFNEKLLYKNSDYSELCSVINTKFIS